MNTVMNTIATAGITLVAAIATANQAPNGQAAADLRNSAYALPTPPRSGTVVTTYPDGRFTIETDGPRHPGRRIVDDFDYKR